VKLQTEGGIAEPLPLSDIQENNRLLRRLVNAIIAISAIGFIYLFWLTYYLIKNNVVNNIVRACA